MRFFITYKEVNKELTIKKYFTLAVPFVIFCAFITPVNANTNYTTQTNAPSWGLDRIDQREQALNTSYRYFYDGTGVDIYILDSGINTSHQEFTGRIKPGKSYPSETVEDCHGHGTHVAGIAAGSTYGVAKKANIIPVKILNCSKYGDIFDVLSAVDWVIAQHDSSRTAVMNLSFASGEFVPALNAKLVSAIADNIVVVAGAGNAGKNAGDYSPSGEPAILTVAGSTVGNSSGNGFMPNSNYGSVVDLFAPASMLQSSWIGSSTAYNSASGTSQAAPFVSGVAALAIQQYPSYSAQQIMDLIIASSTDNALSSVPSGTINRMIYSLLDNDITNVVSTTTSTTTTTTIPETTTSTTTSTTVVPETAITVVPTTTLAPTTTVEQTTTTLGETTTTVAPTTTVEFTTTTVAPTTTVAFVVPITTTTVSSITTTTTTVFVTTTFPTTTTTVVSNSSSESSSKSSSTGGSSSSSSSAGSSSSTSGSGDSSTPVQTTTTLAATTTSSSTTVLPIAVVTTTIPFLTTITTVPSLKPVSITCVRAKIVRKITAVKPVCPKGFVLVKNLKQVSSSDKRKVNTKRR